MQVKDQVQSITTSASGSSGFIDKLTQTGSFTGLEGLSVLSVDSTTTPAAESSESGAGMYFHGRWQMIVSLHSLHRSFAKCAWDEASWACSCIVDGTAPLSD